jgi:hypothetical protein
MNQQQGTFWKTEEQREQVLPSEYFMGCYFGSGYTSYMWNKNKVGVKIAVCVPLVCFANQRQQQLTLALSLY